MLDYCRAPRHISGYYLLDNPSVTLRLSGILNPANLLPIVEDSKAEHDCLEILKAVFSGRIDLTEQPLQNMDWDLFTDGTSFMENVQ